ncbi:MAG: META domain-containing protein [Rikenellaceae bacterium]|nr:META domain-containing protein [Rikenellaceae bacterium]
MRNFAHLLIFAAVTLLITSCCACRSYQKKTRRPLVGTEWQLIRLGGQDITPKAGTYTIVLSEQGTLSGMGSCNRIMGNYKTTEKRALKIESLGTTRMMCPDSKGEQDFVAALEATTHYEMDGPMLLLLANGELRAVLKALPEQSGNAKQ